MKKLTALCLTGIILLLTGCNSVTPYRQPLAASPAQPKIVNVRITRLHEGQEGNMDQVVLPINKELVNFNADQYFKEQLNRQLNRINIKTTGPAGENTALVVKIYYRLNNKFNALMMNANIEAYGKAAHAAEGMEPLYKNSITYINYLPRSEHDHFQSVYSWTENKGQLLKDTLREAAVAIAQWTAVDFKDPRADLYENMKNKNAINFYDEYQQELTGKLITLQNDLYVIRMPDDKLYIVNHYALKAS